MVGRDSPMGALSIWPTPDRQAKQSLFNQDSPSVSIRNSIGSKSKLNLDAWIAHNVQTKPTGKHIRL